MKDSLKSQVMIGTSKGTSVLLLYFTRTPPVRHPHIAPYYTPSFYNIKI